MNRYTVEMAFDATDDEFNEIMEAVADMVMGQPNGAIVSEREPRKGRDEATGIRTVLSRLDGLGDSGARGTWPAPAVCPECRQGKCANCDGRAMGEDDEIVWCACPDGGHAA